MVVLDVGQLEQLHPLLLLVVTVHRVLHPQLVVLQTQPHPGPPPPHLPPEPADQQLRYILFSAVTFELNCPRITKL